MCRNCYQPLRAHGKKPDTTPPSSPGSGGKDAKVFQRFRVNRDRSIDHSVPAKERTSEATNLEGVTQGKVSGVVGVASQTAVKSPSPIPPETTSTSSSSSTRQSELTKPPSPAVAPSGTPPSAKPQQPPPPIAKVTTTPSPISKATTPAAMGTRSTSGVKLPSRPLPPATIVHKPPPPATVGTTKGPLPTKVATPPIKQVPNLANENESVPNLANESESVPTEAQPHNKETNIAPPSDNSECEAEKKTAHSTPTYSTAKEKEVNISIAEETPAIAADVERAREGGGEGEIASEVQREDEGVCKTESESREKVGGETGECVVEEVMEVVELSQANQTLESSLLEYMLSTREGQGEGEGEGEDTLHTPQEEGTTQEGEGEGEGEGGEGESTPLTTQEEGGAQGGATQEEQQLQKTVTHSQEAVSEGVREGVCEGVREEVQVQERGVVAVGEILQYATNKIAEETAVESADLGDEEKDNEQGQEECVGVASDEMDGVLQDDGEGTDGARKVVKSIKKRLSIKKSKKKPTEDKTGQPSPPPPSG